MSQKMVGKSDNDSAHISGRVEGSACLHDAMK